MYPLKKSGNRHIADHSQMNEISLIKCSNVSQGQVTDIVKQY